MTLPEYDIAGLQRSFDDGGVSSADICRAYIDRIANIDRAGPTLRSVIQINPEAIEIAAGLDQERQQEGPRSHLHGVPILIKDNIDSADGMMTTAGSLALEGNVAPRDAPLVDRLRRAGAVILGKTNLSEWAFFRSVRGVSGWSSRGGQVVNPYGLDRSPSGSSSGSGVSVAANLCVAAIGTETDGSIISPSSITGIVGLKPTVGLISRTGIVPIAHSQDTPGPMARSVADAAALLTVLAGPDSGDAATEALANHEPIDYRHFLRADGLDGVRIGVARDFFGRLSAADEVIEGAIDRLRALGATIVDPVRFSSMSQISAAEQQVLLFEFKAGVNSYLAEHPKARVRTLADVIDFNRRHADRMMPYFEQELLEAAEAKGDLNDPDYLEALSECRRLARDEGIDLALNEHQLDAVLAASTDPSWLIDRALGDGLVTGGAARSYHLPAVAGYPHITVPAGYVSGLPVGLSFFGGPYREAQLIQYAYAFEQATMARQPPTFPPTLSA